MEFLDYGVAAALAFAVLREMRLLRTSLTEHLSAIATKLDTHHVTMVESFKKAA
jgi:hypothetical protein